MQQSGIFKNIRVKDFAKIYSTAIPFSTFININVETKKNRILVRAKWHSIVYLRTHVSHKYSNSILSKTKFVANFLFILPRRIIFILWLYHYLRYTFCKYKPGLFQCKFFLFSLQFHFSVTLILHFNPNQNFVHLRES